MKKRGLLVLSRQRDEAIVMSFGDATDEQLLSLRDEPIRVVCVDIRGEKIRTGVKAPRFVHVDREEVFRLRESARGLVPTSSQTREATEAVLRKE